jgi:thioredoxin 1
MALLHLTDKNFEEEVVNSPVPVLVDFWAEWCGPCKMLNPVIEEVARDLSGKLKVAKVNVDDAQELAVRFGIMSIPTLLVFKQGKVVGQIVGAMPKDQLLAKLNPALT